MSTTIVLADNLYRLRLHRKASQQEVAERLLIKRSTYSAYELGTAEPPLRVLVALADMHTLPVDVLLRVLAPQPCTLSMRQFLAKYQPNACTAP